MSYFSIPDPYAPVIYTRWVNVKDITEIMRYVARNATNENNIHEQNKTVKNMTNITS